MAALFDMESETIESPQIECESDRISKINLNDSTYQDKCKQVSIISRPLANRKLTKKIYKLIKKSSKSKNLIRGVKNVVKSVMKDEVGLAVIAGNVTPIDTISHVPIFLEEKNIPYIYVPSKEDIGASLGSSRPTCMVLIKSTQENQEYLEEVRSKINEKNIM